MYYVGPIGSVIVAVLLAAVLAKDNGQPARKYQDRLPQSTVYPDQQFAADTAGMLRNMRTAKEAIEMTAQVVRGFVGASGARCDACGDPQHEPPLSADEEPITNVRFHTGAK